MYIIFTVIENLTTKNVGNKIKVPTGLTTIGMMAPAVVWAIVSDPESNTSSYQFVLRGNEWSFTFFSVTDLDDGTDVTGDGEFDDVSPGPVTYNDF